MFFISARKIFANRYLTIYMTYMSHSCRIKFFYAIKHLCKGLIPDVCVADNDTCRNVCVSVIFCKQSYFS